MKKNVLIIGIVVLIIGFFTIESNASSEIKSDPLVTLSYLDQRIEAFKVYVDNNSQGTTAKSAKFEVVEVKAGQTVIFTDASVEFILRSGDATAIASENGGLADLTEGVDLLTGDFVKKNHLMLIPRNDNRGIVAKSDLWIMIKGTYEFR
jgi:hypothetical protein